MADKQMYEVKMVDASDGQLKSYEVVDASARSRLNDFQNGNYGEMTVGSAEELLSDKYTEDKEPYLIRKTPVDSGMEIDSLVGGSVAWNQLARPLTSTYWETESGVTVSFSDGVATISSTTSGNGIRISSRPWTPIVGHVMLLSFEAKGAQGANPKFTLSGQGSSFAVAGTLSTANTWTRFSGIRTETSTSGILYLYDAGTCTNLSFRNAVFIDLTKMLGSTIADYIKTLETATAGAGVAWFRKYFPDDYYAYNAGELKHVTASAHKTVGFNLWDEEWEVGAYNTSGQPISYDSVRSKNFVEVDPNLSYYMKTSSSTMYVCFYTSAKVFISRTGVMDAALEIPSNAKYLTFNAVGAYGTVYKDNICLNYYDSSKNGTYVPYKGSHTYPLDNTLTLRGIPKLANNKLYYDGDTYSDDGTVVRKYGVVDLGTLTWAKNGNATQYYSTTSITKGVSDANGGTVICAKYIAGNAYDNPVDKNVCVHGSATSRIWVYDTAYTDAATFKTAMNGVYLVYELATPTTESKASFKNPQNCDPDGTEQYVSTGIVPVGHYTKYLKNLKGILDDIPSLPTSAGTYTLKVTVSGGVPTYTWQST